MYTQIYNDPNPNPEYSSPKVKSKTIQCVLNIQNNGVQCTNIAAEELVLKNSNYYFMYQYKNKQIRHSQFRVLTLHFTLRLICREIVDIYQIVCNSKQRIELKAKVA